MHNNYYFLRQLSRSLGQRLEGHSVVSCFSQNKNELIIEFNNEKESFFIKAHLLPSFSCLAFPSQFSRARKNSVDLFDPIILKKFISVTQFKNERSFALNFEQGYSVIFKMHANRANLLLAKDDQVIQIFRNQFKADYDLKTSDLHREIDWSEDYFNRNFDNLRQAYFTFGREIWNHLIRQGFDESNHKGSWKLLNDVLTQLSQPKFYLVRSKGKVKLSLFNEEQVPNHFTDPIDAINEFFFLKTTTETLEREKGILLKKLISNIEGSESYIAKNKSKLSEITDITKYKSWADILMANLHQIEKGSKQITLSDFNGVPVTIKLKPELTAQKNAEIFYRKAKNQEIEIRKISESIDQKKKEIESSQKLIEGLEKITTLSEFKLQFGSAKTKKSKKEESLPFHQSEHLGYQILIGKNAAANDLLTLKYAHKDDLWLHAKDVSGSHVVVKHKSGQPFPKEVIERAAELAAYNSKRKSETLCPVSYTHKKFVRKRKGDPAGAVVVEREQVIMVTPKMI